MNRATRASGAIAAVCLLAVAACSSEGDETTSESAPATAVADSSEEPATTDPPETTPSTAAATTAPPPTTSVAPATGGASVSVVLSDPFGPAGTPSQFAVEPDPISVDAGSLEIVAKNQGGDVHNLVIVKGDDPTLLPVDEFGAVIEGDLPEGDFIGKIALVSAGMDQSASFGLDAGSYILFCNLVTLVESPESHFKVGMVNTLTVT